MNLKRMKRANANKTPDKACRTFDMTDPLVEFQVRQWTDQYRRHMLLKHGKKSRDVIITQFEDVERLHYRTYCLELAKK